MPGQTQETTDNQTIQELHDEVKDLNNTLKKAIKSNDNFSKIFVAFGLIQAVIGIYTFVVSVQSGQLNPWYGLFWVLVLTGSIFMIVKSFEK